MYEHLRRYSEKYHYKINNLVKPLFQQLGLNYFHYYSLNSEGHWALLSSNPDFAAHYVDNELFKHDEMLRHPSNFSNGTVFWSSLNGETQEHLVLPFQKLFDMQQGFSLIKSQGEHGLEAISFTAPKTNALALNRCVNSLSVFHQFFSHLKRELAPELAGLHAHPLDLVKLKGDSFKHIEPNDAFLSPQQDLQLRALYISPDSNHESWKLLSERERQCVLLLLEGKSAQASSNYLGISRRTIEHYLDNIRSKLDCNRKADLIALFRDKVG